MNELSIYVVLKRLRSDDVYHQLKVFLMPEHRSTALATQASMLVIWFFSTVNIALSFNKQFSKIKTAASLKTAIISFNKLNAPVGHRNAVGAATVLEGNKNH